MIAANYRKFPEAMALQMPLQFGRALVWALSRPTTRILRAIRADRGAAFKAAGRLAYPEQRTTPAWVVEAKTRARGLARAVKKACLSLDLAAMPATKRNAFQQHLDRVRASLQR